MNKTSTTSAKCITLIIIATLFAINTEAQSAPKLKFRQPQLVSGIGGTVGAIYKFTSVTAGVDAFIKIEDINNGAILVNIDDSTVGYYDAWQPTVGGPDAVGSSYIKWEIKFKTPSGAAYKFATVDASAIDVDGDNGGISEFVGVNGQSSYDVPTQIPTLLSVISTNDSDENDDDDDDDNNNNNNNNNNYNPDNLWAYGPITNRPNIDTSSEDVRINYNFTNSSKIKFYTGSTVRSPGGALNRYHSIYFMDITNQNWSTLPVTYLSFDATLYNNTVNLSWTVNAALKNEHYEVERSFDQINFSASGVVLGAQSENNGVNKFGFTDKDAEILKHRVIYYRLKQEDMNGKYTYSVVKTIRIAEVAAQKTTIQVMPNPYMDKLNINFESNTGGMAEVRLISASGTIIKKVASAINKGLNNLQLQDLRNQNPGMYVVNIVVNGISVNSQKIIKN